MIYYLKPYNKLNSFITFIFRYNDRHRKLCFGIIFYFLITNLKLNIIGKHLAIDIITYVNDKHFANFELEKFIFLSKLCHNLILKKYKL